MKFLIAVDDTEASWDAARFAAELAHDDDELIVINVVGSIEPHDVRITAGSVTGRILAVAEAEQPDMIVTGTRDQHAILRFLGGSVSQTLVNDAPCAVLVVR